MAKKKKKAKSTKSSSSPSFWSALFSNKIILIVLVCALITGGAFYGLWYFFNNSRFFAIKQIIVNDEGRYSAWTGEERLKELYTNRNIFSLNLTEIELWIKQQSPQLKTVVVRKIMPDRIEVDLVSREPFAFINTSGGLIIDKDGVVLNRGKNKYDLPEIKGIRFFFNAPRNGEKIDNAMLEKALMLLDGLKGKGILRRNKVEYIDISDRNNMQLGIEGVNIKMGRSDFSDKIIRLKEMLNDPKVDMRKINYVDLRFDDIIISPR
jgi:cell division septal protein FtsQ